MTSKLTIEQAKRLRNDFECWQQDYDPKDDKEQYDMFGRGMAAMDMLIAGMYQEPVAWIVHARTGDQLTTDGSYVANAEGILGLHSTPLYRHAQPAPVAQCVPLGDSPYDVPHSMPSNLRELIAEEIGILFSDDDAQSVWDVCRRAAMLQAKPVTTANKLPKTQFEQVADLYEMQFDDGRTCAFHTDAEKAVQWLNTCDGNKVQEYVKLERLQEAVSGYSPVIPDGYVMVPMRLTAENGAKSALSGEFSETKFVNCPECFGDDECETCDGSGRIEITVPVTWTTIKEIWAKGVEHFAAAPQELK